MLRSSQVLFPPKREAFLKRGGFCSQRSVSEQLPILPHTHGGLRRRLARGRSKTSLPVAALEGKEAQIPLETRAGSEPPYVGCYFFNGLPVIDFNESTGKSPGRRRG